MKGKLWCWLGVHEYEVYQSGKVYVHDDYYTYVVETYSYYDCRCKCCGKIKTFKGKP